jgi:hypothetical protein
MMRKKGKNIVRKAFVKFDDIYALALTINKFLQ